MSVLEYVSLAEAKAQVRAPGSIDDTRLTLLLRAASAAVKNYLGDFSAYEGERDSNDDDEILDSNFEPEIEIDTATGYRLVRQEVKVAVLLLIDRWYNGNMEGMPGDTLPPEVRAVLYPLRDPVCR